MALKDDNEVDDEEHRIDEELDVERKRYEVLRSKIDALETSAREMHDTLARADGETRDALRQLLDERRDAKSAEASFKRDCRRRLDELDAELARLQESDKIQKDEGAKYLNTDEPTALRHEFDALADELARLNRDVFRLEREAERQPSQIELSQYQRRFMELLQQVTEKHRETKRFYVMHNTLVDVQHFVKREIDLLNSIDDTRNLASRYDYKDSFVENLLNISRNIEQTLDKALCAKRTAQEGRNALSDQLQSLIDKQRLYMRTVAEFEAECQKNETLREEVAKKNS